MGITGMINRKQRIGIVAVVAAVGIGGAGAAMAATGAGAYLLLAGHKKEWPFQVRDEVRSRHRRSGRLYAILDIQQQPVIPPRRKAGGGHLSGQDFKVTPTRLFCRRDRGYLDRLGLAVQRASDHYLFPRELFGRLLIA